MTSDGITADSLLTIYRELYHRFEVLGQPRNTRLLPSRSVTVLESAARAGNYCWSIIWIMAMTLWKATW
ncbi:L-lysine 6-monooxygenase [Salmonella enterica subsp. arizonae]|nr:L-lysine 6-monooxygenase [Salmonella enterica subsp. arizonae]